MEALTLSGITFYKDDTIETIQQLIALREESHPDRLYIEVLGSFPSTYYSTNPKHWMDLFNRLSVDGATVTQQQMDIYLRKIRLESSVVAKAYTLDQWKAVPEELTAIYKPDGDTFTEWRILGVDTEQSFILDVPPPATINIPTYKIPVPQPKSLFETYHSYDTLDFRVTIASDSANESVKRVYFPSLTDSTPPNIQALSGNIEKTRQEYTALLALNAPSYEKSSVIRLKWRIPLISTKIHMPYVQFEQMFYGLTLSKDVPYVGMFTAKTESLRHKFFVEDPKKKVPYINPKLIRVWLNNTMPQERTPTLILYRGESSNVFDRISINKHDIVLDIRRDKSNKKTKEELKKYIMEWLTSLDAIIPFLNTNDIEESRWEVEDSTVIASYAKPIEILNRNRVNCLQSMFGVQEDGFRLLRTEQTSQNVSTQILQAYQLLKEENSQAYLMSEMKISESESQKLIKDIEDLTETNFNFDRALRKYPVVQFFAKEIVVQHAVNSERTLRYIDILRYVLTESNDEIQNICPEDLRVDNAVSVVPQQEVVIPEDNEDGFEFDFEGVELYEPDEEVVEEPVSNAAPRKRTIAVQQEVSKSYGYFHERLKKFDPDTFEKITEYPRICEKKRQVVVLTEEDRNRIRTKKGPQYTYEDAPENEQLNINDPDGTFICPPYWCVRDEIPLRGDQLVDNACPVCGGKIQTAKQTGPDYTVIERKQLDKYPGYQTKEGIGRVPCCFKMPNRGVEVLNAESKQRNTSEVYIYREMMQDVPPLRASYLSQELAQRLKIQTDYEHTIDLKKINNLAFGKSDVFLFGMGHPSETLPIFFNDQKTKIPNPIDVKEKVMKCSFFQQWRNTREGETNLDRIINDINTAYKNKEMSFQHELEYVTMFLECEVIFINPTTFQVFCGFWSNTLGANSRTIAIVGNTILGYMKREKTGRKVNTVYSVNLRMKPFGETVWPYLLRLHRKACSVQNMPTYEDAVNELVKANKPQYKVILDPIGRMQAVFVPGEVLLPFAPTNEEHPKVDVRNGYSNVTDEELPTGTTMRAFLANTTHAGLKLVAEHENVNGYISELGLASGLRIPIQPEATENPTKPTEITETVRAHEEKDLVDGTINAEDKKLAENIVYSGEVYDFLLYSLSNDIETDPSGDILNSSFRNLRTSIQTQSGDILKELKAWFKVQGYTERTQSPIEFINKVRTPCGQLTKKDACENSNLCGWHEQTCKIKINPVIEINDVLKRIAKTLKDNPKQRSLVLDNRLSPFFSTILYFELPHELIVNDLKSFD